MRKEEVASLVIYVLMIAVAIIVGLSVVKTTMQSCAPANMNQFLFVILTIVVGLIFNITMLEVLHVIGALIGGYAVSSVNILGICFEKKDGKIKVGFKDFDGLTGETRITPKKEKLNLKPFIWLPLFGYAAELAGCIVLHSSMSQNSTSSASWLAVCAILFIIISSMIALYNLVPIKLDSMTDGYRMVLISKPANVEALNELMRAEELQRQGKEIGEIKVFTEITEFTANINLFTVYKHLKNNEFKEAEEIIDMMLANPKKLEPYTHQRLISQKIYISIMTKSIEDAKKDYDALADDKVRRFIANDVSMESVRAYLLISGILEKSQGELRYAITRKNKAIKRCPKDRAKIEEDLYQGALNKVYEAHPTWNEDKENAAA